MTDNQVDEYGMWKNWEFSEGADNCFLINLIFNFSQGKFACAKIHFLSRLLLD